MAGKKFEIDKDASNSNRIYWKVQFIGYVIMFLFIVASFCGLFGTNFFSKTKTNGTNTLSVTYNLLGRTSVSSQIKLNIHNKNNLENNKNLSVRISNSYFEKMLIKHIYPTPIYEINAADYIQLNFATHESNNDFIIYFVVEPQSAGFTETKISLANDDAIILKQFNYP